MLKTPSAENLSQPFTFVQLNFWDGRLYYPIDNFLARERPDIFSLQELLSCPVNAAPSFYTAEGLVEKGHFDHVIAGDAKPFMQIKNKHFDLMCGTLLKAPLSCAAVHRTILHLPDDAAPDPYYSLLHAEVRLGDGALVHVLNHHAKLVIEGRMGSPLTDHVFRAIADYVRTLSGPVILSGDFNLHRDAAPLRHLKAIGLVNLNDVYDVTKARNEFSWQPDEAVSHVFVNEKVTVDSYDVPQDNVSDHLPLRLKCRVVKPSV